MTTPIPLRRGRAPRRRSPPALARDLQRRREVQTAANAKYGANRVITTPDNEHGPGGKPHIHLDLRPVTLDVDQGVGYQLKGKRVAVDPKTADADVPPPSRPGIAGHGGGVLMMPSMILRVMSYFRGFTRPQRRAQRASRESTISSIVEQIARGEPPMPITAGPRPVANQL